MQKKLYVSFPKEICIELNISPHNEETNLREKLAKKVCMEVSSVMANCNIVIESLLSNTRFFYNEPLW